MKVLFDYQIFHSQMFGGISRYFYDLIREFHSNDNVDYTLALEYTINEYLLNDNDLDIQAKKPEPPRLSSWDKISFRGKGKIDSIIGKKSKEIDFGSLNQERALSEISRGKFDVFHPTYYSDYFIPALKGKKFVLTVYDMIHEIYPEYLMHDIDSARLKREMIRKADRIIAISENTKNDIVSILGIDPGKIDVIHLNTSFHQLYDQRDTSYDLGYKYLLFTGVRAGYKNFYSFLMAVEPILKQRKDLKLVCTGPAFNDTELSYFKALGVTDQLIHKFAHDVELANLYANAEAFIFPSLYEGFGIPVLESFACQCPTLVADSSSLSEICGNGAIKFDPKSLSDIRNSVEKVLENEGLKNELVSNANEVLKEFSREKTAQMTLESYQKTIG